MLRKQRKTATWIHILHSNSVWTSEMAVTKQNYVSYAEAEVIIGSLTCILTLSLAQSPGLTFSLLLTSWRNSAYWLIPVISFMSTSYQGKLSLEKQLWISLFTFSSLEIKSIKARAVHPFVCSKKENLKVYLAQEQYKSCEKKRL